MFKRLLLTAALSFAVLTCSNADAQNLCPPGVASDKLICLLPQVFGVNGLVLANNLPSGTFESTFLSSSLRPLDSSLSRQSAFLPLASPSSGITFSWDPVHRVFSPSTDTFGPIFGERAETIGKHRVFLALTYQYLKFQTLDGVNLKSFPLVFTQQDFDLNGRICSVSGDNKDDCGFIRDVIKTDNGLDLKIHQFTTFVTFGLTNRIDVSLALPVENVRMAIFSSATIVPNSQTFAHVFPDRPGCSPCFTNSFSNVRSVSGVGDMTLRVKGTPWRGERAGLALGVDVRAPTGDELNFVGAGAAGVKPFVVLSYRSRISPHVFVGYEANGSSRIAGDISTGRKERLPSQLTYSGGVDAWLTKWFTTAFDLVGQQVFEARRTSVTTFTEPRACADSNCFADSTKPANTDLSLSQFTGSYNTTNASVGAKLKPGGNLLITVNVLIKLNDGGLRAKVVPLVGLSYTF